jgi:putative transposase
MPRAARIDIAGVLQHVIFRGIERRDIFVDDQDRRSFLDRFCVLLGKMEVECLAWALMKNHAHLLLRPGHKNLGAFMRRLLTGYAVTFNLRHHRSGHLFQNRYKSIICQDDPYLLELVRYIHLNPLRVGLVRDLHELKVYPWSGHSVIMGAREFPAQKVDEVLLYFSTKRKLARQKYQEFAADGVDQGRRSELVGGGLRRVLISLGNDVITAYDDRILGSGDFVERLREEKEILERLETRPSLQQLIESLANRYGVSLEEVSQRRRGSALSEAKGIICHVATRMLGYSGEVVGKALGISRSGVCRGAVRGGEILKEDVTLKDEVEALVNRSTPSP